MIADLEGFPGWWCGACRGPLGRSEPTRDTRCPRCGEHAWPLDERLRDALTDAGLDEDDTAAALDAVLPLVTGGSTPNPTEATGSNAPSDGHQQ